MSDDSRRDFLKNAAFALAGGAVGTAATWAALKDEGTSSGVAEGQIAVDIFIGGMCAMVERGPDDKKTVDVLWVDGKNVGIDEHLPLLMAPATEVKWDAGGLIQSTPLASLVTPTNYFLELADLVQESLDIVHKPIDGCPTPDNLHAVEWAVGIQAVTGKSEKIEKKHLDTSKSRMVHARLHLTRGKIETAATSPQQWVIGGKDRAVAKMLHYHATVAPRDGRVTFEATEYGSGRKTLLSFKPIKPTLQLMLWNVSAPGSRHNHYPFAKLLTGEPNALPPAKSSMELCGRRGDRGIGTLEPWYSGFPECDPNWGEGDP